MAIGMIAGIVPHAAAQPDTFGMPPMDGFAILTSENTPSIEPTTVVIEFNGPIAPPMSANLATIWARIASSQRFERLVLRLDSPGGIDTEGKKAIATLAKVRERMDLVTLVGERDLCASMCVALFIQGQRRYARPTSSWIFHGASPVMNGLPDERMTARHFDAFRSRGIDDDFIAFLQENDFLSRPGGYWISGSELAQRSNIITDLLANWQPAQPIRANSAATTQGRPDSGRSG